ncbi:MAG: hypothetical protein LC746_11515 [Acidobacteria bacterium]|nr:hypothetical protein [Acidobacteriota bacterium]
MSLSRRKFLRAGAVSAVLAGLELNPAKLVFGQQMGAGAAKGGFTVPYEAKTEAVFYFTHETFAPYLNSTFRLSRGKGIAFDATLVSVSDTAAKSQARARAFKSQPREGACFELKFRAGERDTVSQGVFKMNHAALGRFSLFAVPGESTADGTTYTAVVNHIA